MTARCGQAGWWPAAVALAFASTAALADGGVYSAYDRNADGHLDRDEFRAYLEKRRIKPAYRDIWRFDNVDRDGDQRIDDRELMEALKREIARRRGAIE